MCFATIRLLCSCLSLFGASRAFQASCASRAVTKTETKDVSLPRRADVARFLDCYFDVQPTHDESRGRSLRIYRRVSNQHGPHCNGLHRIGGRMPKLHRERKKKIHRKAKTFTRADRFASHFRIFSLPLTAQRIDDNRKTCKSMFGSMGTNAAEPERGEAAEERAK